MRAGSIDKKGIIGEFFFKKLILGEDSSLKTWDVNSVSLETGKGLLHWWTLMEYGFQDIKHAGIGKAFLQSAC